MSWRIWKRGRSGSPGSVAGASLQASPSARLSLRTRLLLWHTTIVAVVLLVTSSAIYSYLSYSMLRLIDTSLEWSATTMERRLKFPDQPAATNAAPIFVPQFVQMIALDGTITDQIRDPEGHTLPIDAAALASAEQHGKQIETISSDYGEPVRVVTHRVADEQGKTDVFIRVGQSLDDLRSAQRRFLAVLAAIVPLALLLTITGGWFLADRAMDPVDRLTRAARSITETNLSQRVEVPRTSDEIQRLAETLNDMLGRLESAFARQRQFTADASHELRTPLAIIRNEMDVTLRRERTGAQYEETLRRLESEVVRLSELVVDLLTLARADGGEAKIDMKIVPIARLAREVFEQVKPLAAAKGVDIRFACVDPSLLVQGDPMRLKQLLLNLLDNAIKYTDAPGQVMLRVEQQDSRVIIEVSDTGRGIAPENLPHIFERFYRQTHTGDTAAGSGLGLAIAKWITDAHQGEIEVESQTGRGSRFRILLSVRKPE